MKQDNLEPENPLARWQTKWDALKLVQPRREGLKATCWLGALGASIHPLFAYLPVKWPLFLMDGFLVVVICLVLWHERNAHKE
jgi:hypothetical protein